MKNIADKTVTSLTYDVTEHIRIVEKRVETQVTGDTYYEISDGTESVELRSHNMQSVFKKLCAIFGFDYDKMVEEKSVQL